MRATGSLALVFLFPSRLATPGGIGHAGLRQVIVPNIQNNRDAICQDSNMVIHDQDAAPFDAVHIPPVMDGAGVGWRNIGGREVGDFTLRDVGNPKPCLYDRSSIRKGID